MNKLFSLAGKFQRKLADVEDEGPATEPSPPPFKEVPVLPRQNIERMLDDPSLSEEEVARLTEQWMAAPDSETPIYVPEDEAVPESEMPETEPPWQEISVRLKISAGDRSIFLQAFNSLIEKKESETEDPARDADLQRTKIGVADLVQRLGLEV
jgi:hypothetical protein